MNEGASRIDREEKAKTHNLMVELGETSETIKIFE
jgi:hypothetical protein